MNSKTKANDFGQKFRSDTRASEKNLNNSRRTELTLEEALTRYRLSYVSDAELNAAAEAGWVDGATEETDASTR